LAKIGQLCEEAIEMKPVNMLDAKTTLSRLVEAVASGREKEVVIARHGRPVARLVPMTAPAAVARIGLARGRFEVPDDIDRSNDEVAALFGSSPGPAAP
jgi:prevent-host-death family protein